MKKWFIILLIAGVIAGGSGVANADSHSVQVAVDVIQSW